MTQAWRDYYVAALQATARKLAHYGALPAPDRVDRTEFRLAETRLARILNKLRPA